MSKEKVAQKAFSALVLSIKQQALGCSQGFAVPSRLVSVSNFQDRLSGLRETGDASRLSVSKDEASEERIVALLKGCTLGLVQKKHVPWLAPLARAGAEGRALQITSATTSAATWLSPAILTPFMRSDTALSDMAWVVGARWPPL